MATSPREQEDSSVPGVDGDETETTPPAALATGDTAPLMTKRTGIMALGVGVILTVGIVAGYAASASFGQGSTGATQPSPSQDAPTSAAAETQLAPIWSSTGVSLLALENGGIIDPVVTKWHDEAAPRIGIALSLFNRAVNQTAGELTRVCYSVRLTAEGLASVPQAPKPDVERAYRDWVRVLQDQGSSCETRRDGESDEQYIARAQEALGSTQVPFESFVVAIDPYIDFNAIPEPSGPAAP